MVHLTAIQETLKVNNAVLKHKLVLDLSKEIINVSFSALLKCPCYVSPALFDCNDGFRLCMRLGKTFQMLKYWQTYKM